LAVFTEIGVSTKTVFIFKQRFVNVGPGRVSNMRSLIRCC